MEDIPENRRRFKQLLIERQVGEGIDLPEIDQKQLHDFMNPDDKELRFKRAKELVQLVDRGLNEMHDFEKAQRSAILELFHREAPFRQVEMDREYFTNRELVEADLRVFLEHAKGDSLVNLSTSNPSQNTSITTQSGEQVKWQTYLDRASSTLFGTKKSQKGRKSDNPHHPAEVLKKLLRTAGVDLPEYIPMDKEYFNNPEIVKADLTAYLKYAKGDSLLDLSTYNPEYSISIQTQSGEQVRWETYLKRASGVLFGTKDNQKRDNPPRPSDTLRDLIRIADDTIPEYIPMDKGYFNNPEILNADLTAYLLHAKGDSLKGMNTNNPKESVSILTQSGEQVRWQIYLRRASAALLDTKEKTDNPHRPVDALRVLLRIADVTIPEYIPMDKEYFSKPDYVKADITAYLEQARGDFLSDLTTSNPSQNTSITTQSGEQVTWRTYLDRASGVLLGTKGGKKSKNLHRRPDALKILKEIAEQASEDEIT